jgi:hypothetical protein
MKYFRNDKIEPIDREINAIYAKMDDMEVTDPEYKTMLSYLKRLTQLKTKSRRLRISPDTVAVVACNLIGIVIIVVYEQRHVITTKGLNQLIRPR